MPSLRKLFRGVVQKIRSRNDQIMRNSGRFERSLAADELSNLTDEADRLDAKYGEDAPSTLEARQDQEASSQRLDDLTANAPR